MKSIFFASTLFLMARGVLAVTAISGFLAASMTSSAVGQEASKRPTASIVELDNALVLQVSDLAMAASSQLQIEVWLSSADVETMPAIRGSVIQSPNSLLFKPKYALQQGKSYLVRIHDESGQLKYEMSTGTQPVKKTASQILSVDPSGDKIPANLLKFYVHFSAPMQKGDIYRHVSLHKQNGEMIELPFLELEQELWSRDSRRVTFLLDPGRIKRGLKPRAEMGPIFEPDQAYEFRVSGEWPDSNGIPLGKDFIKRFSTFQEDFEQPDPANWKIQVPNAGTLESLVIQLDEPLDREMLFRVIKILGSEDKPVTGNVSVNKPGTQYEFSPYKPWRKGTIKIVVDTVLEDLAGNSIGRQFDVDRFESKSEQPAPVVELNATVK